MIILGIDYGTKNIGLAVSDETCLVAGALALLPNYGLERAVEDVAQKAKVERADLVLLGAPLNNPNSPMLKVVQEFGEKLAAKSGLAVKLWDESFSSINVEKLLRGKAVKKSDSLVAQVILQEYLDFKKETKNL